jgi:alkylation response protein AidB-like acyl-CoA dehydrogenase
MTLPAAPTEMPDLRESTEQSQLREAVRALLADYAPVDLTLSRLESGEVAPPGLARMLAADVGAAGLAVPESLGGAGASWAETAIVTEELGRAVAPVPFFGSAVLATAALLAAGETELLGRLASGEATATLVVPFGAHAGSDTGVEAHGGALSGLVASVLDAGEAQQLLVPAEGGLYVVAASDARVRPVTSLDLTRPVADVTFDAAPARPLVEGAAAGRVLSRVGSVGAAMLAAEQLGLASRALDLTVDYLKTRHQFGRAVGSYQALKHRLADLWVQLTQARAVVRYAAAQVSGDDDGEAEVAAALAQAFCSPLAVHAAEEMLQLHGGIGFTWEHPAHLYLKRAKADAIGLGTPEAHRERLAELVGLPS